MIQKAKPLYRQVQGSTDQQGQKGTGGLRSRVVAWTCLQYKALQQSLVRVARSNRRKLLLSLFLDRLYNVVLCLQQPQASSIQLCRVLNLLLGLHLLLLAFILLADLGLLCFYELQLLNVELLSRKKVQLNQTEAPGNQRR